MYRQPNAERVVILVNITRLATFLQNPVITAVLLTTHVTNVHHVNLNRLSRKSRLHLLRLLGNIFVKRVLRVVHLVGKMTVSGGILVQPKHIVKTAVQKNTFVN